MIWSSKKRRRWNELDDDQSLELQFAFESFTILFKAGFELGVVEQSVLVGVVELEQVVHQVCSKRENK